MGQQRIRCLESITDSMDMNLSKLGDGAGQRSLVCMFMESQRVGQDLGNKQQKNKTSQADLPLSHTLPGAKPS